MQPAPRGSNMNAYLLLFNIQARFFGCLNFNNRVNSKFSISKKKLFSYLFSTLALELPDDKCKRQKNQFLMILMVERVTKQAGATSTGLN